MHLLLTIFSDFIDNKITIKESTMMYLYSIYSILFPSCRQMTALSSELETLLRDPLHFLDEYFERIQLRLISTLNKRSSS